MGLSQQKLAALSGLSRTTVNRLEQGSIADLSIQRTSRLLDVLGIHLQVADGGVRRQRPAATMTALERAALSAGISFKRRIGAAPLRRVLSGEEVRETWIAHVRAFLEDAPVSLLADVAAQLEREDGLARTTTWARMRQLATWMGSTRDIWS